MSHPPPRTAGVLRVLALAPYPEGAPSTRYRIVQMLPALRGLGIEVTLHPVVSAADYPAVRRRGALAVAALARSARNLSAVLDTAGSYDAVLVQRGMSLLRDRAHLPRLARAGVPLLFDFDDAVFLPQPGGSRWLEALRNPGGTTEALCRAAARVLAGNAYLADFARSAVGPAEEGRVRVVPTAVDTSDLVPRERVGSLPTLGWVGSDTTVPYLESLAPALRRLTEVVPHRLLVVGGSRRPRLPGATFEFAPWSAEREAELIGSMDVGLYPLDDTPWSRGKCGFKALQYLACGVPCVASPVGVLREIVRPGVTGLHAVGEDEWVESCARLLSGAEERRRMGEAGRTLVEERYSVARVAPLVAAAVHAAVGAGSFAATPERRSR
ncbi:MAG: glycosyltransferase family 4 protein [Longimicrobiales bacterium]|nr:glycosyltransferase family 4 protein [Longimicrobiales bacterium]